MTNETSPPSAPAPEAPAPRRFGGERGGRGGGPRRRFDAPARDLGAWQPKTELGRRVKAGEITTMSQALSSGLPLRESEVVDILLPNLEDEVIDVNMVQRMTDSGRRVKFRVVSVIGNRDGFVGLGMAKGKEVGPTIQRAIDNAKLNLIEVRRGCGSWQCACRTAHTVPVAVTGKSASVEITLKPAPRGVGLATGDVAKQILKFAGVRDVWGRAEGQTKTTINSAKAAFEALRRASGVKVRASQREVLALAEGSVVG
ncbi:MAG TPA: 30S ribosomal protein S5 [Candidatus Thermoplasmatota archaeon]|nr:30S ribosomal protein S5 [Candidatus Thermoplasmatota archaeon]